MRILDKIEIGIFSVWGCLVFIFLVWGIVIFLRGGLK